MRTIPLRVPLALLFVALLAVAALPATLASSHHHNDAASGKDAGDTFDTALRVEPFGTHWGSFASPTDLNDYYKFHVEQGQSLSIDLFANLITGAIQVNDATRRPGVRLLDPNGILLDTPNSNVGDSRVTLLSAHVTGDYRLHFDRQTLGVTSYGFCFATVGDPCVTYGLRHIELLTALPNPDVNVLLIPPTHGNPLGSETALDYLDATLRGIRDWEDALDQFAQDYPQYSYLTQVDAHVEIFDGTPKHAGYDVVVVWAEYTGPIFRGLASNPWGTGAVHGSPCFVGLTCQYRDAHSPYVRDGGRVIVLSLFASAPRAGQAMPDWPEVNDVYNVVKHEFAHTWGLGHTQTWFQDTGPDLMNSPYTDVFGDGDTLGDGGVRTPEYCISSLDLYGMARLYSWLPSGDFDARDTSRLVTLPWWMPYERYC